MDSAVARRIARELALVQSGKIGPHVFHGATMLPFLVDGDEVAIEPVTFDQIQPGDVVTYRDQQYFPTRRVIRIDRRSRSLILKGDAIPHLTFFVLEEDVLGRATSIVRGERRLSAADAEWRNTAEAIVARERRRARTAWLPGWLGLGPDDAPAAPVAGQDARPTIGDPWWRVGRAAIDLDALQVVRALLAGEPDRATWTLSRMKARRFLDFARENGIAGDLVMLAQDSGGGVSAVFDPILAELIESARLQRAINRKVLGHLHDVAEIFDRRGIESIVLKGPHLSLGYYGSLDQRRMGDLDLLVRRRDLRAASAALAESGYASRTGAPLGMGPTLRFVHHLEHEKDGVPVDLHHQIRVHPTFRLDEEEMWRTAGRLDLGSRTVRVLSHPYVLLTLILSIHNDIGLGTADLHPFFDLDRVLSRASDTIDWKEFFAGRRRERTDAIAVNVLALHIMLMGGVERHPELFAEVAARADRLVLEPDRRAHVELIQGASLAAKKRWAFAQLGTSLPAATLWWLLGLPVHALVYRRIFFRNFAQRLSLRRSTRERGQTRDSAASKRIATRTVDGAATIATPAGPLAAFGIDLAGLPAMSTRPLRLGSLSIELHADRSFAPDVLEELFRLEGARGDAESGAGRCDVRVRIFDATLDDLHRMTPPPFAPVVRRELEGIVEIHHQAASALVLRPRADGPVEVVLPIRPASAASATARTATTAEQMLVHSLMIVFYRMLLELDCLHLHTAAVEWDGETSLFLGGKGAGKSTLCLALARSGATVLGEDHVLVRRGERGFTVSGCDANMRLSAQTEAALLPQPPTGRKAWFGGVLKREFDLRETGFAVRPFVDFEPRRIFFPTVGARVAIQPMRRARAMAKILEAIHDRHAIAGAPDARRLLDWVGTFVDRLEAWELELSPRLDELDAVVDFVASGRPARARTLAAGSGAP
jgi:hypothetical protein